jgi:UDP-N-acetylmuramoylalanine--D-glutamate ligase
MSLEMMETRTLALHRPDLSGLPVLVVGAGRSGRAAARLAAARGADVTLCDSRAVEQLPRETVALRDPRIRLVAGGHPAQLADDAALIVVSPGVPENIALLERARELKIPIWGEVELAYRFCEGRIVGISGSNGKSTVTTMVGGILRLAGFPGATGGNLDRPLSEMLADDSKQAWHSLELSSFQLSTVHSFRAQVAVVLNLSADHLDRHPSFEA